MCSPTTYLIQAEVAMSLCDGFAEAMRKRIQHTVMRVYRGQAVLFQLVSHNANQLLHALIIISPVAHNLKRIIILTSQ